MSDSPVFLTLDFAQRSRECVRDFERRAHRQGVRRWRQPVPRGPIRGILLDDLDSDGTADVAVTVKVSSPAIQKVALLGQPSADSQFTLSFKGQTTGQIPYKTTADDLQEILQALETVGPGNVLVALGKLPATVNRPEAFPGLWLVSFVGAFLSRAPSTIELLVPQGLDNAVAAVVVQHEQWDVSGEVITVAASVPVGTPTPMRAGAVVTVDRFGAEYCVRTCEPRNFGSPY